MQPFVEIIEDELKRRGASAISEALRVGLSRDAIRSILRGRVPSVDRAVEICEALGLEVYIGRPRGPGGTPQDAAAAAAELFHRAQGELERLRARAAAAATRFDNEGTRIVLKELREQDSRTEEVLDRSPPKASGTCELSDLTALASRGIDDLSARQVEVVEVAAAAGGGAVVGEERVVGYLAFQRKWLDRHGLDPTQCVVMSAQGESMEPTLPAGCSILVNRGQTRRRVGQIYVVRTTEGLVAKRAGKGEGGGWQLVSDHPTWKPVPWPSDAEVLGEVKWMAKTL